MYTPTNWVDRTPSNSGTPINAANMNKIEGGIEDVTLQTEQHITDNDIHVTAAEKTKLSGIEDRSLYPIKMAFFEPGKNLFNKYTVTVGKYVYWVDGTLVNSANYVASDYIAVMPETKYAKNYSNHIAYYDVDKLFLSGVQFSGTTIETPADCRYIRISVAVGSAFEQVELGETTTSYESFHFKIKEDLPTAPIKLIPAGRVGTAEIADAAVTSEKIANEAVTSEKLSAGAVDEGKISDKAVGFDKLGFTVGGLNLFNAATAIEGYYVSNITGGIWSNATYWASDYIEVEPETEYTENYSYYMAFYDDTKTFISGLGMTAKPHLTPRTFTTPAGCKFMRVSIYQSFLNLFQVEKGYFVSHFEKYRGYIDNSALPGETANTLLLNVAPTIPAVVGKTVNVYFDNIMCADNIDNYQLDVTCAKGKHRREKWEYTPGSGDVGAVNFEIAVYKKFGLVGKVKRSLKTVAANSGAGQTLKVNIIGDSTTANGVMVGELYNLFNSDDMSVTFIGTQGDNPKKHEGHSGKNAEWIQTNGSSPFVFSGSFDYAEYLNANSLDAPDVVILNLGINDMFTYIADNDVNAAVKTFIGRYDAMMENIKLANADMKFGVCVTIPSGNQDAFGSSYDCGQTSWRYKRNNRILGNALINYYKGKEDDNIYLVPINVNLDTVNNMAMGAAAAINSRNPATIQRQINGVHPGNYGYYQIADMMFCWLKSIA